MGGGLIMSLLSYFDSQQLKSLLRVSNYWASFNRNRYPEKMNDAISELYEWVDCPCDENCECRKHGCKQHLVRKTGVGFERYLHHFLQCYVDGRSQEAVLDGRIKGRASKAVPVIDVIRSEWDVVYANLPSNKSLVCTGWSIDPYNGFSKEFKPSGENIYMSKWMTLLSMNTYVAYDTNSVPLLNRDFGKPQTYYDLMASIRSDLIEHLNRDNVSVMDFLHYDNPSEFVPSLPVNGLMPLGVIIDKLYLTL